MQTSEQWIVTIDLRDGKDPVEIVVWKTGELIEIPRYLYRSYPRLSVVSSRKAGFLETDGILGNPLKGER